MMIDLDADKKIVGAATDGPWDTIGANSHHGVYVENSIGETICDFYFMGTGEWNARDVYPHGDKANVNAEFTANFNPSKITEYHDYIGALKVDLGLTNIRLENKSTLLESCETALESRDAKIEAQDKRIEELMDCLESLVITKSLPKAHTKMLGVAAKLIMQQPKTGGE